MAMAVMKTEEHLGGRRPCMEDCETSERRHVKRRRRDTVASSLGITKQEAELTAAQTTVKRSSRFRGVSRHRWTGRYEAHLWDKLSWNVTQKKKGKQVYLGAYDDEEAAARAYDLAALKYWGTSTFVNFPLSDYEEDIEIMQNLTKEEYLASLRRKSSGFSRGVSKYRGVARHHHNGRWEARIGRVFGNKYLYLGTYSTQEEAAHAYDIAAIEYRGVNAVTNFDLSTYFTWLKPAANNSAPAKVTEPSMQSQEEPSTFSLGKKLQVSCLETNASRANDLNKQEMHGRKVLLNSYRRSSSPTALSLLLRSSVFRELVEKNSNLLEEEIDENRTKNPQQQMSIDEYQFCDLPLLLSTGPGIELQEQLRFNYDYLDSFGSSATNMVSLC